jgi:UDPglucose 6-dehydrogenase
MSIAVVGTGHVGLVTCVSLAAVGHDVVGTDADRKKVATLAGGETPFFEPGVTEAMRRELAAGRLRFTERMADAVAGSEVVFLCVGTPARASGAANLAALEEAARRVVVDATGPLVVVEKSTVPAGTADRLYRTLLLERPDLAGSVDVASNPEFLREGQALRDALEPERILVGVRSDRGRDVMRRVYAPFTDRGVRLVETDITTAELAKHASNAFLALKISFANALARICERVGGDVEAIADVMGADARIGRAFLGAGLGYGGYCFPKDLEAFEALARDVGYEMPLLREISRINDEAVDAAVGKVRDAVWNVEGKRIAVLGLAFKPGTDDVRFSPAIALVERLLAEGASVVGCDPVAAPSAQIECPGLVVAENPYDAARGAHCLVVATAWEEFADLDLVKLHEIMAFPIIVDGRNLLNASAVARAGFHYLPTGRPPASPTGDGQDG